ncbi:MAG: metalloregulator ArsR/SmtB family transcription factor [Cytophagales bacterium]|nr:metalloregulator ArsR/SmtB family transcription factor [Cytophagales bacterium]
MGISKTDLFTAEQNELARYAKVLAHPARIAIIDHLLKMNVCINSDLVQELGLAQATISQHLKELKLSGIIKGTVEGNAMCYCLDYQVWKEVQQLFDGMFDKLQPEGSCC